MKRWKFNNGSWQAKRPVYQSSGQV